MLSQAWLTRRSLPRLIIRPGLTISRARKYLRISGISSRWRWNEVPQSPLDRHCILVLISCIQPGSGLVRESHHHKKTRQWSDCDYLRAPGSSGVLLFYARGRRLRPGPDVEDRPGAYVRTHGV